MVSVIKHPIATFNLPSKWQNMHFVIKNKQRNPKAIEVEAGT